MIFAAKAEEGGLRVRTAFAGREAGRLMSFPATTIRADASLEQAVEDFFVPYRYAAFPVLDGGRPVGLVDLDAVEPIPAHRRAALTVGQVAVLDPDLIVDEHQDVGALLERPVFQRVGRAVVQSADGGIGILSITDVNRALRAYDLKSAPAAQARSA